MNREEHLVFCKTCINKKMDRQGLICKLTNEKAIFDKECVNYKNNGSEKDHINKIKTQNNDLGLLGSWQMALLLSICGFAKAALREFEDTFGIIAFILGIIWLILALIIKITKTEIKTEIKEEINTPKLIILQTEDTLDKDFTSKEQEDWIENPEKCPACGFSEIFNKNECPDCGLNLI